MKRYSKFLTFLLIILAISLVVLVVYSIYTLYNDYMADKSAEDLLSQFESNYENDPEEEPSVDDNEELPEENPDVNVDETPNTPTESKPQKNTSSKGGSSYGIGTTYQGFKVIGAISIPKLNVQYPIFKDDNPTTLKVRNCSYISISSRNSIKQTRKCSNCWAQL